MEKRNTAAAPVMAESKPSHQMKRKLWFTIIILLSAKKRTGLANVKSHQSGFLSDMLKKD